MDSKKTDRRSVIKALGLATVASAMPITRIFSKDVDINAKESPVLGDIRNITQHDVSNFVSRPPDIPFVPRRAASWWVTIDDLQWSQKSIKDKIKRRAAAFAEARIDMAINFGFHNRFDFANYFGRVHGYYANVCEELHQYGIKFMDHFSCNHVTRPKNEEEYQKVMTGQRHALLLFYDPIAAAHAQYEGHFYNDLCEKVISDGSRGYAWQYQFESFCHNNPGFLDMHTKYLERLLKEVPLDAIEVDDMCSYPGLATCGCQYCRERFRRDYGREIPPFEDKNFWGDTQKPMLQWGNYNNPAFRDFIRMKSDGIADHVKLIKSVVGNLPLQTCCSSSGPIVLNSISLDLEKISPYLDFFMLENCGFNIRSVNWMPMEAEALHQKDIAQQRGGAPAIALSYTIYEKGGYLGWALSRFWGVANWSSTLNGRLEVDPPDAMEQEDVIRKWNNWELTNSNLDFREELDVEEVRLVSNRYCRDNGWRDDQGREHWSRVKAWSALLIQHNIGYRFLRAAELSNPEALKKEKTPLILDGVACVSDKQYSAISSFLASGGNVWLALPFGTHDEKGNQRKEPLSGQLIKSFGKRITAIKPAIEQDPVSQLVTSRQFEPVIQQLSGGREWAIRLRLHNGVPTFHLMNTAMKAIPHPTLKDLSGIPVLQDIDSSVADGKLSYRLKLDIPGNIQFEMMSPETDAQKQPVTITKEKKGYSLMQVDMSQLKIYGVIQQKNIG